VRDSNPQYKLVEPLAGLTENIGRVELVVVSVVVDLEELVELPEELVIAANVK
jgi:hypothetical protein